MNESNFIPLNFKAYIGGYGGPSYSVEMINPALIRYSSFKESIIPDKEIEFEVTPESWKTLRTSLEKAMVFNWKDEYVDTGVLDGTGWSFVVKYPDLQKEVNGSNAYPKKEEFDSFLKAISVLVRNNIFE